MALFLYEALNSAGQEVKAELEAPTKEEASKGQEKVLPPRYDVAITLIGVAPSDLEVSRYITELNLFSLVRDVNLLYSEEQEIDGQTMRKFSIDLKLDPNADVRSLDPSPRLKTDRDPMGGDVQFGVEAPAGGTAPPAKTPANDPRRKGD